VGSPPLNRHHGTLIGYVKNSNYLQKKVTIMVEVLRTTTSICPECMEPIKADIYVDDEKNWVMMRKNCKKHGDFLDKISINPEQYKWQNGYVDSLGSRMDTAPINIENKETKKGCPYDCGLCKDHNPPPVWWFWISLIGATWTVLYALPTPTAKGEL